MIVEDVRGVAGLHVHGVHFNGSFGLNADHWYLCQTRTPLFADFKWGLKVCDHVAVIAVMWTAVCV